QGLLPVRVGLDPVAVADVDDRPAGKPFHRAVQRLDAPVTHLVHVDVEGRLVELDHVHAHGGELARFLVDERGEGEAELGAAAVVGVVDGVHHRHRTGHGELDPAPRRGAEKLRLVAVDGATAAVRYRYRGQVLRVTVGVVHE